LGIMDAYVNKLLQNHRQAWIVQSHLPGGANVRSQLIHGSLGQQEFTMQMAS